MTSTFRTLLRLQSFSRYVTRRRLSESAAAAKLAEPQADGAEKVYSPKLEKIYQSIVELNLLEVAELNDLLKTRLKLPDAPVMAVGSMMPGAAPPQQEASEEEEVQNVKTSFTVKLMKFDEKQKIALIKELKILLPDLNLVQAKKIVESAPTVLMSDIGKDEADKFKEQLSKAGGEILIE